MGEKNIHTREHIAKVGQFITIGGAAGVGSASREPAGPDIGSLTRQILEAFEVTLASGRDQAMQLLSRGMTVDRSAGSKALH